MSSEIFFRPARSGDLLRLRARIIRILAVFSLFTSAIGFFAALTLDLVDTRGLMITAAFVVLDLLALALVSLKRVRLATLLLVGVYAASTIFIPMAYLLLAMLTLIAAATLGNTPIFAAANLIILGELGLRIAQDFIRAQETGATPNYDNFTLMLTLFIVSLATRYFIRHMEQAAANAKTSASLLQSVAETGEILAKLLSLKELLPRAVELIRERFAFYHVQVFLLDESGEYAELAASTGALGQKLMERRHKLAVGSQSVIGTVTLKNEPVIARDTDPIYYRNELLPNTRAELALPISDGEKLIGALDVQSRRPDAFDPESVQALQIMANLLGTSIRNAQLFEQQARNARETRRLFLESETNLREIQRLNQQLTRQGWESYLRSRRQTHGVTLSDETETNGSEDWSDTLVKATQTRKPVADEGVIAVPVILGGEVIGAIEVEPGEAERQVETLEMVTAVAQRLAISLDKARLYEESQEATAQEQSINNIVARYQTVSSVDDLLQITLAELSQSLGAKRGAIRLTRASVNGEAQ